MFVDVAYILSLCLHVHTADLDSLLTEWRWRRPLAALYVRRFYTTSSLPRTTTTTVGDLQDVPGTQRSQVRRESLTKRCTK
uniref:Putative secreted protein n=1 Tax=Anopheles marajoara TaxID=58244 RepID=A0A2M4CBS1_9DIPT